MPFIPRLSTLALAVATLAMSQPVHLRTEYLTNPLGIDAPHPHFSWYSDNPQRNWRQSAYQIVVRSAAETIWDSGKQTSADSNGIAYAGPALSSEHRYSWSVRVWDAKGHATTSKEDSWFETGLLNKDDWKAKWIRWVNPEDAADRAAIRWIWLAGQDALKVAPNTDATFRTKIVLPGLPRSAAIYVLARGNHKASVNGVEVSVKNDWNAFDRQEIANLLHSGENTVEVSVHVPPRPQFGPDAGKPEDPRPAALAVLVKVVDLQGTLHRYTTGSEWQGRLAAQTDFTPAQALDFDLADKRLGRDPGLLPQPAALYRHAFTVGRKVASARAYVTALGSYRLFLNGQRVGNDVLTPEFTDYGKRVLYQTYDVTSLLANGENVAAAIVGDGWFASGISWTAFHFSVLPPTRWLAQIRVRYTDGTDDLITTDDTWRASQSPILNSEIYGGEKYDARLEQPGWNATGFKDSSWSNAITLDAPPIAVSSQPDVPVRVIQTIHPKAVTEPSPGVFVVDIGQNIAGWVKMRATGKAGTIVRLRFAEILNPDGNIYTLNLRNADATDVYTLRGGGEESFTPLFTFHGFRYVELTGYPGKPTADDITAEVISSVSGEPTATLNTSSALVNHMWGIGIWGQRGNFLSIPTDCPQRDERLGWTGDAGVFWRTGTYNFDTSAFTNKWMQDMRDAQSARGAFPNVAPDIGLGVDVEGAPGWGDAGVIVPWTAWAQFGDRHFIDENWDAMQRWLKFIAEGNPNFLRRERVGPNFGDWLAPNSETPQDLLGTAYWALITHMMEQMAHATGRNDDAARYAEMFSNIRAAFQKEWVKPDGVVGNGSQTSYVVALHAGLLTDSQRAVAIANLVKDIDKHEGHLTTGFLGAPFLLSTLANNGHAEVAYKLLLNETYPSWGYMLSKGATTWWERWNGDTGDPAMNSYNHYAFGSVVAWVYRSVVGIDTLPDSPGFREIVFYPRAGHQITHARGEYQSVNGKISSDWQDGTEFKLAITVPANCTAKVYLPAKASGRVKQNGKKVSTEPGPDQTLLVKVGAGNYRFVSQ